MKEASLFELVSYESSYELEGNLETVRKNLDEILLDHGLTQRASQ